MTERLEFVYVGDPMCSWCWGFVPVLDGLSERFGLPLRVVVGGLRPGDMAETMTDAMAEFLTGCWTQVAEASGQPFDHRLLERRDWSYDTLPSCAAVAFVRQEDESLAMPLFKRLQRAFYAENIDISTPEHYAPLLTDVGIEPEPVLQALESGVAAKMAWTDFSQARRWGISGFPALLLRRGEELSLVTKGWAPLDALGDGLEQFFESEGLAGATCSVDGC